MATIDSDLAYRSAADLAALIRTRQVSSVEVTTAALARIDARNPALNAVTLRDDPSALRQAAAADRSLAAGAPLGPLHGVPLTLKDCHATADLPTPAGFPKWRDFRATRDGAVAARLRAAGAVILGKTNVPTLLQDFQSDNPIFGRTNNPWDPTRAPGGSSGGAAAALAAGFTPLEVGSDLGGSIRNPAHYCGVFGFKPTERRIPMTGHLPPLPDAPRTARVMASIGPMARTVEDLILAFTILAGPDGEDSEVAPVPVIPAPPVEPRALRIAISPTLPHVAISAEIQAAVSRVGALLADAGAVVAIAFAPIDAEAHEALYQRLLHAILQARARRPPDAPPVTLGDYLGDLHERDHAIRQWESFLADWDAILLPVAPTVAFPHQPTDTPLAVDDSVIPYWHAPRPCTLVNLTGHPSVAIPIGISENGLPIGAQLVGRRWEDSALLAVAATVSALIGPWKAPPGYR